MERGQIVRRREKEGNENCWNSGFQNMDVPASILISNFFNCAISQPISVLTLCTFSGTAFDT
jgi:hypothetical protein